MQRNNLVLFYVLLILCCSHVWAIERVVIWGHKLHSHTHSYVHYGFYKAFNKMGYETLWLDNNDDLTGINLQNSIFITEHQVDERIPILDGCYYVVHNSESKKYDRIKASNHYIDLKVYRKHFLNSETLEEVEPYIFYDLQKSVLIMPWATDLLPEEIEENKERSPLHRIQTLSKTIYWVGTIGGGKLGNDKEISAFRNACQSAGVRFIHSDPWTHPIDAGENAELVRQSYLAPAICGAIQLEEEYIPCRIFKNISYGHIGITNSQSVCNIFNQKIVYNPDCYQLFYDGVQKLQEGDVKELCALMDFVKENHTYLNRAKHILEFINLLAK